MRCRAAKERILIEMERGNDAKPRAKRPERYGFVLMLVWVSQLNSLSFGEEVQDHLYARISHTLRRNLAEPGGQFR